MAKIQRFLVHRNCLIKKNASIPVIHHHFETAAGHGTPNHVLIRHVGEVVATQLETELPPLLASRHVMQHIRLQIEPVGIGIRSVAVARHLQSISEIPSPPTTVGIHVAMMPRDIDQLFTKNAIIMGTFTDIRSVGKHIIARQTRLPIALRKAGIPMGFNASGKNQRHVLWHPKAIGRRHPLNPVLNL